MFEFSTPPHPHCGPDNHNGPVVAPLPGSLVTKQRILSGCRRRYCRNIMWQGQFPNISPWSGYIDALHTARDRALEGGVRHVMGYRCLRYLPPLHRVAPCRRLSENPSIASFGSTSVNGNKSCPFPTFAGRQFNRQMRLRPARPFLGVPRTDVICKSSVDAGRWTFRLMLASVSVDG